MKSSFIKTFLLTSAILLSSYVILGSSFALLTYRYTINEHREQLHANAEVMSEMASTFVYSNSIVVDRQLTTLVFLTGRSTGYSIILTDSLGNVLITSDPLFTQTRRRVGDRPIRAVVEEGQYSAIGTLGDFFPDEYFSVGVPVVSKAGGTVGAVFVSSSSRNIRGVLYGFSRLFISSAAAALLLSLVWTYAAAQRMTRPMAKMTGVVEQFARGDFSARLQKSKRRDEVGRLSSAFNHMAEELEKTEELRRDFIANISHELKTPMTTIGGYVDGMLDGVLPEEKREDYLRIVSSEVKRLSRLVTQLLELSRMESGQEVVLNRQKFDLCEKTRLVILGLEQKINDRKLDVEVNFEDYENAVMVYAEPDSIVRVIYNLADNAIKYAFEGTTIKISIDRRDRKAHFSITDEGNPIPPEAREQIFERFYKTDRSRKSEGLGLGLYMVKNILRMHGEDVICETEGRLTTIRFALPLGE